MAYDGIFRGTVESNVGSDADGRLRVRVRVDGVHDNNNVADLPFADLCQMVGKMRGKFFPFQVGDRVWVMFEGGVQHAPVILGGQITNSSGIPDVPLDQQVEKHPDVVVEQDAAGNTVITDGRLAERKMIFRSGGAEIMITGNGDRVVLEAAQGSVEVRGANVTVVAGNATLRSTAVTIEANGRDDSGIMSERANDRINRVTESSQVATDQASATKGKINDGGNIAQLRGVPLPTTPAQQTNVHNLRSKFVNIGVGPTAFVMDEDAGDAGVSPQVDYEPNMAEAAEAAASGVPASPFPLRPTLVINIRSQDAVNIVSKKIVIGGAEEVNVLSQGDLNVTALGDVNAEVTGNMAATVAGKADVNVMGDVNATVGGRVTAAVTGDVTLDVAGNAAANVHGSLTAYVDGNLEGRILGDATLTVVGTLQALIGGKVDLTAGGNLTVNCPEITLASTVNILGPLTVSGIPFLYHTHLYSPGPGGPTPSAPPA